MSVLLPTRVPRNILGNQMCILSWPLGHHSLHIFCEASFKRSFCIWKGSRAQQKNSVRGSELRVHPGINKKFNTLVFACMECFLMHFRRRKSATARNQLLGNRCHLSVLPVLWKSLLSLEAQRKSI